jgi:hypothetical protein
MNKHCNCHMKCGGGDEISERTWRIHRRWREFDERNPGWWLTGRGVHDLADEEDNRNDVEVCEKNTGHINRLTDISMQNNDAMAVEDSNEDDDLRPDPGSFEDLENQAPSPPFHPASPVRPDSRSNSSHSAGHSRSRSRLRSHSRSRPHSRSHSRSRSYSRSRSHSRMQSRSRSRSRSHSHSRSHSRSRSRSRPRSRSPRMQSPPRDEGAGNAPPLTFEDMPEPHLDELRIAMRFIRALQGATHENFSASRSPESEKVLAAILDRIYEPLQEAFNIENPDHLLSLELFLSAENTSRSAYKKQCKGVKRRSPTMKMLSWAQVNSRLAAWTGIDLVKHDMCIESHVGFTGPFEDLLECPTCGAARYDQPAWEASGGQNRVPRKQFFTIPVAPQIQARFAVEERAKKMQYCFEQLRANLATAQANGGAMPVHDDVWSGLEFLQRWERGEIKEGDVFIFYATDSAQLYQNKAWDCWVSIAVILNLPPNVRYKESEILPVCIIPGGEHKPKNMDSFNYPVFHHMAALMKQGFNVRNAALGGRVHPCKLHLSLAGADCIAMVTLDGGVGHHGACGCRLHCPYKGRRKEGGSQYYPALQRPDNYDVPGCTHPDELPAKVASHVSDEQEYLKKLRRILSARTRAEYEAARLATGLVKPSLFLGFPLDRTFGVPGTFCVDMMHVPALNAGDLFIPLFRGSITHDKRDPQSREEWPWSQRLRDPDVWQEHGRRVELSRPYFPGWYDRVPRNPATKINTKYKGMEWMNYLYGLGPMVFREDLPDEHWDNFCKYVRIIELIGGDSITTAELEQLDELIQSFHWEFEELYVQRIAARLHFVRPWMHTLLHVPNETVGKGPTSYYSQWTLERMIGVFKGNLRLHSNPGANMAHIALRFCQINTLKAIIPELDEDEDDPGLDLGDGYRELQPHDTYRRRVNDSEAEVLNQYMQERGLEGDEEWNEECSVLRFGRLGVPNGSVVRTAWKELLKPLEALRTSRMAEVTSARSINV